MLRKYFYITIFTLVGHTSVAQQFIGNTVSDFSAIQMMPYNPAWVNNSYNGAEIHFMGINIFAGTNAYYLDKGWVLGGADGAGIEGEHYYRDRKKNIKHIWANADVLGPMVAFTYKKEHQFGIYTRYRQIVRGGNISSSEIKLIGDAMDSFLYDQPITFNNAGFTNYSFGEIGFTYGKILRHDDYHFLKAGVTVKYLAGFAAASIYTKGITYNRHNGDTIGNISGDLTTVYTYNLNPLIDDNAGNDMGAWSNRAGRNGLGLDIGVQYEYHPDGNPNEETPYLFSIAASITDLGSVKYIADTGSANYEVNAKQRPKTDFERQKNEEIGWYLIRQVDDTALYVNESFQKFRVGLPTAFRVNFDWNILPKLNIASNILLNMRGSNGTVYKPGYINYFNITPSYGISTLRVGLPLTFTSYRSVGLGLNFRLGPLYVGSSSLFSSLILTKEWIKNVDGYIGLSIKIKKADDYLWYR